VRYGAIAAVDHVTLDVAAGQVMCLLGPSGAGKSTLLRLVAGIERPAAGRIAIDGTVVADSHTFVEPERRRVGMVFQDFALFPHLTVAENVAFGLRGVQHRDASATVVAMLERVDLVRYAGSYPHTLSGGERQRVALARALAPAPRMLLMDEPFSSLDGRLRDHVRQQTLEILRQTHTTTVIVTHEPTEALRISDRIALMRQGRIEQVGSPRELYARPATLFAARFFSDVNEIPCLYRHGQVETPLGTFPASAERDGEDVCVCIRPEHLRIASRPTNVAARVVRSEFRGEADHVVLAVDGVMKPVTLRAFGSARLSPGEMVHLEVANDHVLVVPLEHRNPEV
jgi:iron(III) transport system ATP-binding protein